MIEAKKIFFSYQNSFSLKNISLKVPKGQILGIIGQSGSGKSTLLNLLGGHLELQNGEIYIEGSLLVPPSKKLISGDVRIKTVTQQNTLFPNITVEENIAYELRFFKKEFQKQRVGKLTKLLNISHIKSKYPRELSGGEIQRVMIAKAIADEPKVLLLDEPFSNLDSIIKKKVLFELKKVVLEEQISCVFVTHEIGDAFGLVDELLILKNGKSIQKGTSEDIYFYPKNKYVALLVGDAFFNISHFNFQGLNGNWFIRPENIVLNNNGEFVGKVLRNVFKGSYFEVFFEFEGNLFYLRNSQTLTDELEFRFSLIFPN